MGKVREEDRRKQGNGDGGMERARTGGKVRGRDEHMWEPVMLLQGRGQPKPIHQVDWACECEWVGELAWMPPQ